MTAASMESCRFAARRSPGGRFWSVVDVRKRLHRTRGGFHRCIHISKVLCALLLWTMICQRFRSRALWGAPSTVQGTTRPQTYPGASPRADLHSKKVNILGPMVPRPRQIRNYPRASSSRRSGPVGPHTTPAIVNYKYMTSTPREGYFGPTTLGT